MRSSTFITGALALALAAPALRAADAPKWYEKVSLGGYAEAYYQQLFIEGSGVAAPQAPLGRAFDKVQSQFQGGSGELTLSASDEASKTGYMLDVLFGTKAASITGDSSTVLAVGAANVSESFGAAKVTVGKYATFIGTEVWGTPGNSNFSRGILYQNEPFGHTGLKLDYSLPMDLVLSGEVDNGDSVTVTATSDKGYGAMLAYSGIKAMPVSIAYYKTPVVVGGDILAKSYANVLLAYTVSDSLGLNAEYLYVCDPTSGTLATPYMVSHGVALYANYATPIAGLSLNGRFEQLTQVDAVNVVDTYTLTLKCAKGPLTHILEYRGDADSAYVFPGMKATDPLTQTQTTVTYAAVYGF